MELGVVKTWDSTSRGISSPPCEIVPQESFNTNVLDFGSCELWGTEWEFLGWADAVDLYF